MRSLITLPKASGLVLGRSGCLLVHSVRETSGSAAAAIRLYDGANASGQLMLSIGLAAGEASTLSYERCVLPFKTSLYLDVVSGAIEGAVSVLSAHDCDEHVRTVVLVPIPAGG